MRCRYRNSLEIVKNSSTNLGKQKYKGKSCHRQFVLNPKSNKIGEEKIQLINKLLLEKISLTWIARSTQVSKRWESTP